MVETEIVNYIAANTSFTKSSDMTIGPLVASKKIGVFQITDYAGFYPLERIRIGVAVAEGDYKTAKETAQTLATLLSQKQGSLDGTWVVASNIETDRIGIDEKRRHIFVLSFTVAYDVSLLG